MTTLPPCSCSPGFLFPSAWELDPAEGYFPPQSDLQGGHHSGSAYILEWRQFLHYCRCAKARLSEFLPSGTLGVPGWNCWAFLTGMEFQLFQNKRLFCFLYVPERLVTASACGDRACGLALCVFPKFWEALFSFLLGKV